MYTYRYFKKKVHRLIPSRYPTVSLFDWADSPEELEQLALLEGLTNDRLKNVYGAINLIPEEDWVSGEGSTPLMAAFTHPGASRFSDGSYGIYYAGDSLGTAIAETKYHRELFLTASHEPPCLIQMREYIATVKHKLVDLDYAHYSYLINPDISSYNVSQTFGKTIKEVNEWGLVYPSVRRVQAQCVAIFRPPALTIPIQGCHLEYIWNGEIIDQVCVASTLSPSQFL